MKRIRYICASLSLAALLLVFPLSLLAQDEYDPWVIEHDFNTDPAGVVFSDDDRCTWRTEDEYSGDEFVDGGYMGCTPRFDPAGLYINNQLIRQEHPGETGDDNTYFDSVAFDLYHHIPDSGYISPENQSIEIALFHNDGTEEIIYQYDIPDGHPEGFITHVSVTVDSVLVADYYEDFLQIRMPANGEGRVRLIVDNLAINGSFFAPKPDEPPQDWDDGFYHSGFCNFTTTITSTNGSGSIITATEVYSQPANLLTNPSFEEGSGSPAGWQDNGSIGYWVFGGRTGSQAIRNYPTQLRQTVKLRGLSGYEVGVYARCESAICGGDTVPVIFNGQTLATASDLITDWVPYSGTVVSGLPNSLFTIDLDQAQNGDVHVDDAWLWPVDASGNVNCDPDLYPPPDGGPDDTYSGPPDCVVDPVTNTCITIPTGGAGEVCYFCQRPSSVSPDSVSLWLAWLGCVLRNMFSCDLRLWFAELNNTARALQETMVTLSNFLANAGQDGANAAAVRAQGAANQLASYWAEWANYAAQTPHQITILNVVEVAQSGADWAAIVWEIIQLLFGLFGSLLRLAYEAVSGFLALLLDIIRQLQLAVTAPAFSLDDFTGSDNGSGAGSPARGISILLVAMATMDSVITDYNLWPFIYTVLGIIGVVVILWTIKQWRDEILPI